MRLIDDLLNRITMYRLVLYVLLVFMGLGVIFSLFGLLPFSPLDLIAMTMFITAVCWIANTIFARVYQAPTNLESVYISALILSLIITPGHTFSDLMFFGWAALLTIATKYILAIGHKHLFNPVAIAVALTALGLNQSANWWVGSQVLFPFVVIGGLLVVRKIRRFRLFLSFFLAFLFVTVLLSLFPDSHISYLISHISKSLIDTPAVFFAAIMLTEPQTTPPTSRLQVLYGALVGFLFAPQIHLGPFYSTPEIALVAGNVFSYLTSPRYKLVLRLQAKYKLSPDIYDLEFSADHRIKFAPGQYMEWTLGHVRPDDRGNRRYFTIASSPTEPRLHLGVKFYPSSSSYKTSLLNLNPGDSIVASQLAGDFTLPADRSRKLVFIAGGIGITPFRSMVKYLTDTHDIRPVTLIYSNKSAADIVYKDVFDAAGQQIGLQSYYVNSDTDGRLDAAKLKSFVPDFPDRVFYLSGPHSLVVAFEDLLKSLGIPASHVKTDYFPGFA